MYKKLLFLVLTFSVTFTFAQNVDELAQLKQEWTDTGYGLLEFFSEPELQVSECTKTEKLFLACMQSLETLLKSMSNEERTVVLGLNEDLKLQILTTKTGTIDKTEEEISAETELLLSNLKTVFTNKNFDQLEAFYEEVKSFSLKELEDVDHAFVAGLAFNKFLSKAYDPHTKVTPKNLSKPQTKNYSGIGAILMKVADEDSPYFNAVAIKPFKGSPAERAGIKNGDLILEVNGQSVLEITVGEAVDLILGEAGTEVSLGLKRICSDSSELKVDEVVTVVRGAISYVPDWVKDSYFVSLEKGLDPIDQICNDEKSEPKAGEPQALYVPMTSFIHISQRNYRLCEEFVNEIQKRDLENNDSVGIVLDLRNNPGGSLQDVSCMLDTVVHGIAGTLIGLQAVQKGVLLDQPVETFYALNFIRYGVPVTPYKNSPVHYNKKIVVLTNSGSASASEIFSGSIQDLERGWVVGDKTFGKGSVQTVFTHSVAEHLAEPNDSVLNINRTTSIYTLFSGRSPQGKGIVPNFRFNELGEPVVEQESKNRKESDLQNTIEFNNTTIAREKSEEDAEILKCAQTPGSFGENLKLKLSNDPRYKIPFVASYQLSFAKDVMTCTEEREPYLN